MEYDSVEYFPDAPTLPDDMVMTEDQQKLIKVGFYLIFRLYLKFNECLLSLTKYAMLLKCMNFNL